MFGTLINRAKWVGVGLLFTVIMIVASGNGHVLGSVASGVHTFFADIFGFFKTVIFGNGKILPKHLKV